MVPDAMTKPMTRALGFFALVALTACGPRAENIRAPQDEAVRRQLVGNWIFADGRGVLRLRADGTFATSATNESKSFLYEGRWLVRSGDLVSILVKSSEPKTMPPGRSDSFKIVRLEPAMVVHVDAHGLTNVLHREP